MHYEFVEQKLADHVSNGDVIDLFADGDGGYTSGRYTVACMEDSGEVTIVGCMPHTAGMIAVIHLGGVE